MLTKNTLMAAVLAAGLAASQASFAQASSDTSFGYLGISGGQADIGSEAAIPMLIDSGTVDGKDMGFKLFGGYMLNNYLGGELAWLSLRGVNYAGSFAGLPVTSGEIDVNGFNLSAVLRLPLGPLAAFFKAGWFLWDSEVSDITGGLPFAGSFDGTDFSWGVGASVSFTRNLAVRAEWERFKILNADTDFVSVGVTYRF